MTDSPHAVQDDFATLRAEAAWRIPHVRAELDAAIDRIEEQYETLLETIGEAMMSLATGPLKDGYAYHVLEEACERVEPSPADSRDEQGRRTWVNPEGHKYVETEPLRRWERADDDPASKPEPCEPGQHIWKLTMGGDEYACVKCGAFTEDARSPARGPHETLGIPETHAADIPHPASRPDFTADAIEDAKFPAVAIRRCDRVDCMNPATGEDAWGKWCDEHNGGCVLDPASKFSGEALLPGSQDVATEHLPAETPSPAISPQTTEYEADGDGRMYAKYDNGDILPTGTICAPFAGESGITPEKYAEFFPASRQEP